jgi:hypothetical protein
LGGGATAADTAPTGDVPATITLLGDLGEMRGGRYAAPVITARAGGEIGMGRYVSPHGTTIDDIEHGGGRSVLVIVVVIAAIV